MFNNLIIILIKVLILLNLYIKLLKIIKLKSARKSIIKSIVNFIKIFYILLRK